VRLLSIGTKFGGTWMQAAIDNPHWEVAGCVARSKQSLKNARKKYSIDEKCLFTEVEEALETVRDIDAVVVATPNDSHYKFAKMVLEHDLNLILEKPITETWEQAVDLVKILDSHPHKKACVGQTLRGDPMLRLMEYWLRKGAIGNIEGLTFQAYWNWLGDPKSG